MLALSRRNVALKNREAVKKAENDQPVIIRRFTRLKDTVERYLVRRLKARYLSRATTICVQKDARPRKVVNKV